MLSIKGLEKWMVIKALHEVSYTQGLGFFAAVGASLGGGHDEKFYKSVAPDYIDYLSGCVMKVALSGDEFCPRLFDRDNGEGSAERAIARLREAAK